MRMNLYVMLHWVQGMSWLNIMQQRKDSYVMIHHICPLSWFDHFGGLRLEFIPRNHCFYGLIWWFI